MGSAGRGDDDDDVNDAKLESEHQMTKTESASESDGE
jgi:hypothetical protein